MMEYRDIFVTLLRKFDERWQSREYLKDLVESTHLFVKMLEGFKKTNRHMVVEKKRTKKRAKKPPKPTAPATEDISPEQLEDLWDDISTDLSAFCQGRETLPDNVAPFDAASEIPIDQQRADAMVRIQDTLRNREAGEGLAMLRAAREVWPERGEFGSEGITPEEEFMALREIFMTALPRGNVANTEEAPNEEEYEDEEAAAAEREEESVAISEQEFNLTEYITKFSKPEIVKTYCTLLAEFATLSPHTAHCTVKMLHRISVDLSLVGMLFQLSLFRVFHKILRCSTARLAQMKEVAKFAKFVVSKFVEAVEKNDLLFIEVLFWKSAKEGSELQSGYGTATFRLMIPGHLDYLYCIERQRKKNQPHGSKHRNWRGTSKAKSAAWTEEHELELRNLYEEHNSVQYDGKDTVDVIMEHFSDSTRSRGQIIRELKKQNLMSSAKDLKRVKPKLDKGVWLEQHLVELAALFEEYKDSDDVVSDIKINLSFDKPKKQIAIQLAALGLKEIAEKDKPKGKKALEPEKAYTSKEFITASDDESSSSSSDDDKPSTKSGPEPETSHKPASSSSSSSSSDSDVPDIVTREHIDSDSDKNSDTSSRTDKTSVKKKTVATPKTKKKAPQKKKDTQKEKKDTRKAAKKKGATKKHAPMDHAEMSQRIADLVTKGWKEPISWIRRCVDNASKSRAKSSQPQPIPIVPLSEPNEDAMEDEHFQDFLSRIDLAPPANEQEAFWRIPAHLTSDYLTQLSQRLDPDQEVIPAPSATPMSPSNTPMSPSNSPMSPSNTPMSPSNTPMSPSGLSNTQNTPSQKSQSLKDSDSSSDDDGADDEAPLNNLLRDKRKRVLSSEDDSDVSTHKQPNTPISQKPLQKLDSDSSDSDSAASEATKPTKKNSRKQSVKNTKKNAKNTTNEDQSTKKNAKKRRKISAIVDSDSDDGSVQSINSDKNREKSKKLSQKLSQNSDSDVEMRDPSQNSNENHSDKDVSHTVGKRKTQTQSIINSDSESNAGSQNVKRKSQNRGIIDSGSESDSISQTMEKRKSHNRGKIDSDSESDASSKSQNRVKIENDKHNTQNPSEMHSDVENDDPHDKQKSQNLGNSINSDSDNEDMVSKTVAKPKTLKRAIIESDSE